MITFSDEEEDERYICTFTVVPAYKTRSKLDLDKIHRQMKGIIGKESVVGVTARVDVCEEQKWYMSVTSSIPFTDEMKLLIESLLGVSQVVFSI